MKKKRLDELEENIKGISTEFVPLMELFQKWQAAVDAGDKETAGKCREDAEPWLRNEDGFTKLAYFPPNDADIAGITSKGDWQRFIKYNYGIKNGVNNE